MHLKLTNQIDRQDKRPLYLGIFLLIWLAVNLIQAAFTELAHDEAYYWMYSRNLAWGYFDHPPMIALLIKIGTAVLPGELGVRLLTSFMGTLTIFIIYCLIDLPKKSLLLFILIVCQVILMHTHVGGFLAIPDIPVLFFSALFLLIYKYYLEKDSYLLAILLALIAALMLYSKYHGLLLIFITFLANIKIARRFSFWIIPVLCAILMIPHLMWQIRSGFPTFEYHLFSRSSAYRIDHTINYLYSQLLIAGPLVFFIILPAAFGYKPANQFDRVLKVNLIAIFILFFFSSFKGHVEAHWTAIAYIPMTVLAYKGAINKAWMDKWLRRLFIPSIIIFLLIRIVLIFDLIENKIGVLQELHGWKKWTSQIDSLAQGRNVVFVNSFQRPSKFTFYTGGKFAHSLNNINYRKNQFDLWPFEDSLQHKPAILLHSRQPDNSILTPVGEKYGYQYIDDFISYYNLKITAEIKNLNTFSGDTIRLKAQMYNPRDIPIDFQQGDRIVVSFHNGHKFIKTIRVFNLNKKHVDVHGTMNLPLDIPISVQAGNYTMYISIATLNQYPAMNCRAIRVNVK